MRWFGAFVCGATLLVGIACGQRAAAAPADAVIRDILAERIDTYRGSVGMVVGMIEPSGRRVVAYGRREAGDPRPLDGDTLFEIGSITKVFTALLLADMVARGEVALADPVGKLLSADAKVPERGGRAITLIDLATHTSALPRMPANFAPKDPLDPYADYSVARLNEFLSSHALTRDIGSKYEYSNLGVGLLGLALCRRAGMDYETLVRARVAEPLGMASTRVALSPELQARLTVGHDGELTKVPNWNLSEAFAGAGALRSSANDLLAFLAANLGYTPTPLAPAMADMLKVRRPIGKDSEIALGWHIVKRAGVDTVWHNGQTGGYYSFIGCDAKARTGVVVLSNASADIADLGMHLLDAGIPLKKQRKEIVVDPKLLDRYVGRYELAPNFILTVTRDAGRLFVQATGQARFEAHAESERDFFYRIVDAQITFETDNQGRATRLILHQNGMNLLGKRLE
jgi:D-alanyl-D-alanine-carboxypeptidase/D-alanyl-D-alanine-endopeptidase